MAHDVAAASVPGNRGVRLAAIASALGWLLLVYPSLRPGSDPWWTIDAVAVFVVLVLVLALPAAGRRAYAWLGAVPNLPFAVASAAIAFATAFVFVRGPLRNQPLSVDAVAYLFQARALAHGHLGAVIPAPRLAFGARFLFEGADGHLHGVFPPGYPLFLVPFVLVHAPLLSGPFTSAALVLALDRLARTALTDRSAARVAVLIALPSAARIVETGDLLSHALVATLAAVALAAALDRRPARGWVRAAVIGGAVGWAFAARMLDGLVLASIVVPFALGRAWREQRVAATMALLVVFALPFVVLVLADQHAATGSWLRPTQEIYFDRSDWPLHCHRLGFGTDVGCSIEHPRSRETFGPAGYTPAAALRVAQSRAVQLGRDLVGVTWITLLAVLLLLVQSDAAGVVLALFGTALGLGYGLFYFGNDVIFGARHLFPAAPAWWVLIARGLTVLPARGSGFADRSHVRAGMAAVLIVLAGVDQRYRHATVSQIVQQVQRPRIDIAASLARARVHRGIVITRDGLSRLAIFDPAHNGGDTLVVQDDRAGNLDLRREHPEMPVVFVVPSGDVGVPALTRPGPGLQLEFETAWPSFQRVSGLAAVPISGRTCCSVDASGENLLWVFQSQRAAMLEIPFDVAIGGRFTLRLVGLGAPDFGDYAIQIDDRPLLLWRGFAPRLTLLRQSSPTPVSLGAGPHSFRATCLGHRPPSVGDLVAFDVLVGEPAP